MKERKKFVHTSSLEQRLADEAKRLERQAKQLPYGKAEKSCYGRPGKTRWPHISVNG